jgi:hypothetical protein
MSFLKNKIIFRIIIPAIILLAGVYLFFKSPFKEINKRTKYIAYIGRYTPPKNQTEPKFDLLHEVTIKEYIDQINLPDTKLELKTFSCKDDGEMSLQIYEEIAKDSNIVAVIDNTWGKHLKFCDKTIKEKNIPVISINADRNNLDFGNNVIFTGNNDHVPSDISAFVTKILKEKKVNFISEDDYLLHETYLTAFKQYGIEVNKIFTVKGKNFTSDDSIRFYKDITAFYKNNPVEQERLTIISVHVPIGNNLIDYINKNFGRMRMLGHAYIVNTSHIQKFGEKNKASLIIISNPTDAVTKKLYGDIDKLKTKYPQYFKDMPNHPMFVERCLDAVEILKNKFDLSQSNGFEHIDSTVTREGFIHFFHSLQNKTIEEEDEIYEFDSLLTVVPELYFTEYSSGRLHSYPLQLNLAREVIPNLFFGMEIIDIYNIDMNANSFTADFYYWVKLDSTNRKAEQFIIFQNMKQNESSRELIFEKTDKATIYKLYKVSGIFFVNYQLRKYPFDEQEIFIRAEILSPSDKLKVSFDQKSFQLEDRAIEKFKITEWDKQKYYVTVDNEINRGMHGDPDIAEDQLNEFKNIYFRLNVKRKTITPMLEIILPLILIGIISISVLLMKDISFENLGEVSIGVFMSIVAFSISFSASTPNSDDLTKADFLFWLTFVVVLLNFMIVIVVNAIYDAEKVKTMDIRKTSVFVFLMYMGLVGWVLLK